MYNEYIALLKKLITIPSFSGEESGTAEAIFDFLQTKGTNPQRHLNNVWAEHPSNHSSKPTVLLNSHHDTVKPSAGWTHDPFVPNEENGRIIGLGSNDAGASVVSLMAAFMHFYERTDLPFNLIYSATAEEENSGENGIESILDGLGAIALAIVGEPTRMEMAVGERGLMVLDCRVNGKAGHAAREEGVNALYKALPVIDWFRNYRFPEVSDVLGESRMTVTQIRAGYQHNIVPDVCEFVVDVRTNDLYPNAKALDIILQNVKCEVTPRSVRLNSSRIDPNHPVVRAARAMGLRTFGSPTTSDQAVIPYPSVKIGPGDSARSHTANEFIHLEEIYRGIDTYIELLGSLDMV